MSEKQVCPKHIKMGVQMGQERHKWPWEGDFHPLLEGMDKFTNILDQREQPRLASMLSNIEP